MSQRIRPWTSEDDVLLLALAKGHKHADIARNLGRSVSAVSCRLANLRNGGDSAPKGYRVNDNRQRWTPEQDSMLLLHYGSMAPVALALKLGKSEKALRNRYSLLRKGKKNSNVVALREGVPVSTTCAEEFSTPTEHSPSGKWSAYDDLRLRLFWGDMSLIDLSLMLQRTTSAVQARVSALNWSRHKAIKFRFEFSQSDLWPEVMRAMSEIEPAIYRERKIARANQLMTSMNLVASALADSGVKDTPLVHQLEAKVYRWGRELAMMPEEYQQGVMTSE